ncbi:hypothetical protein EDB69_0698 [Vibrio crassostreae]|uniref:hypothetical protein n=1 Tax=Vibrio TaxID=662 RepID=UPI000D3CF5EB|nr:MULTISPECIES: hypothetical protein [Vibrio]PTO87575.1 hypothetical protein CWO08_23455 [Vibrio sp. 10N.286.48.B8]ROO76014.1 hypothetical protein EDB64_0998 [Vibrio crassostreae]ROP14020.1 hypothetical protein EDB63_1023 [Vibrio crassostreae]ROQ88109.1 hypothetical protein EDB72_1665 [Vibrio crassostreae]RPE94742.1 hypothetical protein EDB68_0775 [Vibrio crassostreae]
MERLDKLFDAAANLLAASEKNEQKFSNAIASIEKTNRSVSRVESETKRTIRESTQNASSEISDKVSEQLFKKLEHAHVKAEQAASRYEKASRYSVLKLSFIMLMFLIGVAVSIWFLFVKDIPTINEINELRSEKAQLQAQIEKLNQYGHITSCGGNLCVSVDKNGRYNSTDGKVIYYVIAPRDSKN